VARRGLIVDDEPVVCETLRKILISNGIEVLTLTKSADASVHFNREKFDVVFLDLHMPAPDGMELTRQMRVSRWNSKTPVVLISDDQSAKALTVAFGAGANFFLYKPIDKDRLVKLLRATQGVAEEDRRRSRRVPVRYKVRLRCRSEELEAEGVNMSLNGLLVKASRTFSVGSRLIVNINVSQNSKPIALPGTVVRITEDSQMAIQFDALSVGETERLQDFLLTQGPPKPMEIARP
jgi:DNA-binding response OmpR family regulator